MNSFGFNESESARNQAMGCLYGGVGEKSRLWKFAMDHVGWYDDKITSVTVIDKHAVRIHSIDDIAGTGVVKAIESTIIHLESFTSELEEDVTAFATSVMESVDFWDSPLSKYTNRLIKCYKENGHHFLVIVKEHKVKEAV